MRRTYNDEFFGSLSRGCVFSILIREGEVPVRGREAAEGADEGDENEDEGDVCAERADEEDEADESWAANNGH